MTSFLGGLAGAMVAIALAMMFDKFLRWAFPARLRDTPMTLRAERWDAKAYGTLPVEAK